MFNIENGIEIQTTAAKVMEALTTQKGVAAWWTPHCTVDDKTATYAFPRKDGSRMQVKFRFEKKAADRVEQVCVENENNPDWQGSRLVVAATPAGKGVKVELVHSGFPAKNETYASCTAGWAHFLASMKAYLETGVGMPYGAGEKAA